jgi:hypothetical protein
MTQASTVTGNTMSELFSIMLDDRAAWTGTRRQRVACTRCGSGQLTPVTNLAHNEFVCHRCHHHVLQYVNVTPHTINPDHTLVAAGISQVSKQVEPAGQLRLRNSLAVINSAEQPVIVESRLGEPDTFPFYENRTGLIVPRTDRGRWATTCAAPLRDFPLYECQVAVEITVYNTWGDPLDIYGGHFNTLDVFARLVDLARRRLEVECEAEARELRWLERQDRRHAARYRALVLELAGHLLHDGRRRGGVR